MQTTFTAAVLACLAAWLSMAAGGASVDQAQGGQPPAGVVADVNGQSITSAEVDKALGVTLAKLEEQMYRLRLDKIDELVGERLIAAEAARRGIPASQLVEAEVTAKAGAVTDQDVDNFFNANRARLRGDEASLKPQIRRMLEQQRLDLRRDAFIQSLRASAKVAVYLKAPTVFRAQVGTDGQYRGPQSAPVTLVEFSDFHCPFCRQVQPTLARLLAKYGDRLKLVYRHYPIDSLHPQARRVAEASACASDQGKFWPFHDKVYEGPATDSSPDRLSGIATAVGLDAARFEKCIADGKHRAAVQRDIDEAMRLGVSGTPGFFINGRHVSGARPYEEFARIVDEELGAGTPRR